MANRRPAPEIPKPCPAEVDKYLNKWNRLENYVDQENALEKLFQGCCRNNTCIECVLLKVAALNTFYSTNVYSTYDMAKHILSISDIDTRLKNGDLALVDEIADLKLKRKPRRFYSFATKYCSFHNPNAYPIYDRHVDKVLHYFMEKDQFIGRTTCNLKDYGTFVSVIQAFQKFYNLQNYNFKQIDKYLWQLGKEYLS